MRERMPPPLIPRRGGKGAQRLLERNGWDFPENHRSYSYGGSVRWNELSRYDMTRYDENRG